uniref:Uncharacterized protein n=1 Tax=Anguilla anguilla TaxID=7936 RepID=A0A0E9RNQ8_ANGAN
MHTVPHGNYLCDHVHNQISLVIPNVTTDCY